MVLEKFDDDYEDSYNDEKMNDIEEKENPPNIDVKEV